jgi:hypothetical protein
MLRAGSSVTPPTSPCATLDLDAFDDRGVAATGATAVTVSVLTGQLVASCADTTAPAASIALALSGATGQVGYIPAGTAQTDTLSTQVGTTVVPFALPVWSTTAPVFLALDGPRTMPVDGFSEELTVSVPAARTSDLIVTMSRPAGAGTIACHAGTLDANDQPVCAGIAAAGGSACSAGGSAPPCTVPIVNGSDAYQVNVQTTGTALVVVQAAAAGHVTATWVLSPWTGASYQSLSGGGVLSYAGDNDFFTIAMPTGMGKGSISLSVTYNGNAQIRVAATRDGSPGGYCDDQGCGAALAGCRGTCMAPGGGCSYVFMNPGSDFNIWVNDDGHDAWDDVEAYSFAITFTEGCPSAVCTTYDCSL